MVVSEGAEDSFFFFGMTGVAVGVIPFSIIPLTYQQYETLTGKIVADLFDVIPPAASDGKTVEYWPAIMHFVTWYFTGDISAAGKSDLSFGPNEVPAAADFTYNVARAIIDDMDAEGDEGFILYFNFTESEIDPADYSRLETGTRTILVTIQDDDSKYVLSC